MSQAGRLLYVDVRIPTPDRDSASQRSMQLLEHLIARGFAIDFAEAFPVERGDPSLLDELGVTILPQREVDLLREYIARHPERYDVVVLCWSRVASRLIDAARAANPTAQILFDTLDVNHVREYRHARVTGNAQALRRAMATKQRELACVAVADCTLAISDVDARALREASPGARVEVVTQLAPALDPDTVGSDPAGDPPPRRGNLFLGSYQDFPNIDAAMYLVREVLPELREHGGDTFTTLAGNQPPAAICTLDDGGEVHVPGYVEDLGSLFDVHQLFACPLRFGSGIKGKLLMTMARGLPAVVTPIAAEGMELRDQCEALVAEEPREFALAMLRLQREPQLRRRIARAAREHVHTRHSAAVLQTQIDRVMAPR